MWLKSLKNNILLVYIMRKIIHNNVGSVIPLLLFLLTILICGALYHLFFVEVLYPSLLGRIPDSDSKTFIMMGMYALPLFIIIIGVFALIKSALKQSFREVYP